jgi:hypothetical protein
MDTTMVATLGSTITWAANSILTVAPPARFDASAVFDPFASNLIVIGGYQDADMPRSFGDTYALHVPQSAPTATLASLVDASSDASGVRLRWNVSAVAGTPCTVERSADGVSWVTAGSAAWTGSHEIAFTGAPLASGARAAYRLRVGQAGGDVLGAVTWLSGPAERVALAVTPLSNPCHGAPSLRLSIAAGAPAHLRLMDVGGRVVSEANVPAGTQQWTVTSALHPGLYFAQLAQGGQRRVARMVIAP